MVPSQALPARAPPDGNDE